MDSDGLFWTNEHDYVATQIEDVDPMDEEWEAMEFDSECGDR